jgi:hypothetical protein
MALAGPIVGSKAETSRTNRELKLRGAASAAPASSGTEADMRDLPPEFRDQLLRERREAKAAADTFVRIYKDGRADDVKTAALWLDETIGGWRLAIIKIGRLKCVTPEVQDAFVTEWITRKHVALKVGDRPACAAALRVLMPGGYSIPPLTLYRGTHEGERKRRLYSFSWTTDVSVARQFAQRHAEAAIGSVAGIVLRTLAPPQAVLLIRQPEGTGFDESEIVVDPYRLGRVIVQERLPLTNTR